MQLIIPPSNHSGLIAHCSNAFPAQWIKYPIHFWQAMGSSRPVSSMTCTLGHSRSSRSSKHNWHPNVPVCAVLQIIWDFFVSPAEICFLSSVAGVLMPTWSVPWQQKNPKCKVSNNLVSEIQNQEIIATRALSGSSWYMAPHQCHLWSSSLPGYIIIARICLCGISGSLRIPGSLA